MQLFTLYKVKTGKLRKWRAWCQTLHSRRRTEALRTLREENTELEFFAIFRIGKSWYTLGTQIGKQIRPPKKTRRINVDHYQIKRECLEFISKQELSYILKA